MRTALFLTLNTFSDIGGIQKVCKTLSHCLVRILTGQFKMFSLYDETHDKRYINGHIFKGFKGCKIYFIIKAISTGYKCKTIIISHIHLITITMCIKMLNKNIRIIMFAHGTEIWRKIPFWKKWFLQKYVQIWAVSKFTEHVLQTHHGITKNIITLNNCLDPLFKIPQDFNKPNYLLHRYGIRVNQPVLLSICRLSKHEYLKGYNKVINLIPSMLKHFPDLHYLLCGKADDQELQRLQTLINQSHMQKHITIINLIHEDELTDHYLLADVFILPSVKEGFGLVFTEAAACGCYIISGNSDGSRDALLNGQLGKMVNSENIEALQDAIFQSLQLKRNYKIKKRLQNLTLEHFGYQTYMQNLQNILPELI